MICDSVTTATSVSLSNNSSGSTELNEIIKKSVNGLYSSEERLSIDPTSGGEFVVMINGLTDAHYTIDELKWESITGQKGNNNSGNYTAMVTEGAMVINEPKGIRFLNDVKKAYELLRRDHNSCVWMIKTIFVGYNDHHTTSLPDAPEYYTNIQPLIFTVIDLEADFNVQGSVYDISFVNINNGVSKMPQINDITSTVKMNLTGDTSLNTTINTLFNKINERYGIYYDTVKQDIISQGLKPLPVIYEVTLSKEYLDAEYLVDDVQQQTTSDGVEKSGAALDFSKGITIENAIKTIMNKCPKIKQDAKGDTATKDKYGFKIRSILDSKKDAYIVKYHIERQKLMFNNILDASKSNDPELQAQLDSNTLTLDYIYTGRNIDIIDYTMKMEMGFIFFQQLTNGNNLHNQTDGSSQGLGKVSEVSDKTPANYEDHEDGGKKNKPKTIPIFFTKNNKNPETINTKNPKDAAEFQSLLNRHAALENIQAKVKIHGNPALLNSINKVPKGFGKDESQKVDADEVFPFWEKVPALLEINIMMPVEENGVVINMEQFWYTGKYYVFSVANEFSGGLFTQELEMISMPNSTPDSENTNTQSTQYAVANEKTEQIETIRSNPDGSKTRLINGVPQVKVKPYIPKKPVISDGESIGTRLSSLKQINT